MVKWNCFVKNKRCPIDDYDEDVELLNIYFKNARGLRMCGGKW